MMLGTAPPHKVALSVQPDLSSLFQLRLLRVEIFQHLMGSVYTDESFQLQFLTAVYLEMLQVKKHFALL